MTENRQNQLNPSDEIELMDLLAVLWRREWLIIIGTLVCIISAGVATFIMPRIYEVSSSIEVGKVDNRFIEVDPCKCQVLFPVPW